MQRQPTPPIISLSLQIQMSWPPGQDEAHLWREKAFDGGRLHVQVIALVGSVFSCCWDTLTSQNIAAFQVQVSNVSCKQCFTLYLHELLLWLSQNLGKESSVINFTLLFNAGDSYIVPVQRKPGSFIWQCCCCAAGNPKSRKSHCFVLRCTQCQAPILY